ncbi:MAG: superoxide dismutase [Ni] [Bacteroidales bacterium]
MKKLFATLLILTFVGFSAQKTFAHCEIPCGIYNDELRIALLYEHFTTIEKSMNKITELSNADDEDYMMITRWTIAKEEHAVKVQDIANQYFLTQRIKPVDESDAEAYAKYIKQVTLMHQIIVYAMKTKQTTDLSHVEKLRELLSQFEDAYFAGQHRHKIEQEGH